MLSRRPVAGAALLAAAMASAAFAGCGGGSDTAAHANAPRTGGDQVLRLSAASSGQLEFSPTSLSANAGTITLVMTNPPSTGEEHGIAVKGNGVDKDGPVVGPGGTSTLTLKLQPGSYEFDCPFDHHAENGKTGTLAVR